MSRRTRPYLPGAAFHITARTHRKEPWFDEAVRDEIVRIMPDAVGSADAKLLAFSVMPNHLHLVVRQGREPLSRLLQPLLRRIAYRVHGSQQFTGYVFERRFRSRTCADADYVRNAIVYTHLNPVRAGLCEDVAGYAWSSHGAFCSPAASEDASSWLRVGDAIRLFACTADADVAQCACDYDRWVRWRLDADRHRKLCDDDAPDLPLPPPPDSTAGDAHWAAAFHADLEAVARKRAPPPRPDLRDLALATISRIAPARDLDSIRGRYGGQVASRLRTEVCRIAAAEGYRNRQIAEFLRISESQVCRHAFGVRRPY